MRRRWDGTTWSAPVRAPFSIPGRDGGSFVSPDGAWFWFSRSDSLAPGRRDLYCVLTDDTLAVPVRLTRTARTGEINISVDSRGQGFLWADRDADGRDAVGLRSVRLAGSQLSVSSSALTIPGHGARGPNSPFVDPQGRFVVFANYGIESGGRADLYVSRLLNGVPQAPRSLGTLVNTSANETAPYITPDGRLLMFSSDRAAPNGKQGVSRIWVILVSRIEALATHPCACCARLQFFVQCNHAVFRAEFQRGSPSIALAASASFWRCASDRRCCASPRASASHGVESADSCAAAARRAHGEWHAAACCYGSATGGPTMAACLVTIPSTARQRMRLPCVYGPIQMVDGWL